jgi:8-oxo-dGTP pyrophosphatase MutT (NUDIX family)
MRPKHVVSTKLALYSHDLTSVLLMHYPLRNIFGLPGGHVEPKENPNDTIRRELMEELSLTLYDIKRTDFFLRGGDHGPIILAFTSIAPINVDVVPTNPKFEYGVWVTKEQVSESNMSKEYIRFVLENWPRRQP